MGILGSGFTMSTSTFLNC